MTYSQVESLALDTDCWNFDSSPPVSSYCCLEVEVTQITLPYLLQKKLYSREKACQCFVHCTLAVSIYIIFMWFNKSYCGVNSKAT